MKIYNTLVDDLRLAEPLTLKSTPHMHIETRYNTYSVFIKQVSL